MHIINKISFSFIIRVPSGNDLLIFLWYNLLYLLNPTWSLNENGTFFVFATKNLTLKSILHILFCIIAKYNYIHSEIFYNISLKTNKQKKKNNPNFYCEFKYKTSQDCLIIFLQILTSQ